MAASTALLCGHPFGDRVLFIPNAYGEYNDFATVESSLAGISKPDVREWQAASVSEPWL